MAVDFAWGQISAAGLLGAGVGLWLGHQLAVGRDKRRERVEAGRQFREPFVDLQRLLAVRHPNHPGGENFQKVEKLVTDRYVVLHQAAIRLEPYLRAATLKKFRLAWDEFCCMKHQPAYPTFDDYRSSSDHVEELAKRDLAMARIRALFALSTGSRRVGIALLGGAEVKPNRMQRTVLTIAGAVAIIMILFPPWQTSFRVPLEAIQSVTSPAQERALMESISHPSTPVVSYRFLFPLPSESSVVDAAGLRTVATYRIAASVLASQFAVLVVVAGAAFILAGLHRR